MLWIRKSFWDNASSDSSFPQGSGRNFVPRCCLISGLKTRIDVQSCSALPMPKNLVQHLLSPPRNLFVELCELPVRFCVHGYTGRQQQWDNVTWFLILEVHCASDFFTLIALRFSPIIFSSVVYVTIKYIKDADFLCSSNGTPSCCREHCKDRAKWDVLQK